jgi:hypothetical protein
VKVASPMNCLPIIRGPGFSDGANPQEAIFDSSPFRLEGFRFISIPICNRIPLKHSSILKANFPNEASDVAHPQEEVPVPHQLTHLHASAVSRCVGSQRRVPHPPAHTTWKLEEFQGGGYIGVRVQGEPPLQNGTPLLKRASLKLPADAFHSLFAPLKCASGLHLLNTKSPLSFTFQDSGSHYRMPMRSTLRGRDLRGMVQIRDDRELQFLQAEVKRESPCPGKYTRTCALPASRTQFHPVRIHGQAVVSGTSLKTQLHAQHYSSSTPKEQKKVDEARAMPWSAYGKHYLPIPKGAPTSMLLALPLLLLLLPLPGLRKTSLR